MSQRSIRTKSDAAAISRHIAGLHLGRWSEAASLLMVRLVPSSTASPLAVTCGDVPGSALAFDVGLSVLHAAVTPTSSLIDRWLAEPTINPSRIRQQGLRNTGHLLSANVVSHRSAGFRLTILSGGLFTTGSIAASDEVLSRLGVVPPAGRRWLSALSATDVLVVDHDDDAPISDLPETASRLIRRVSALCADMAAITEKPLPANLYPMPFAGADQR